MSHDTHSNAALTPRARLKLARLVVEESWPIARAADRYDVSYKTAQKWSRRYRDEGAAGMLDSSSRPHHRPRRTPTRLVKKIVGLRIRLRLGPIEIADRLGLAASTVHAVLVRCRLNRLTHIYRITGEPIRRYERDRPGELLHVDVKKLGKVPDGGGWRFVGRQQGGRNRAATSARTGAPKSAYRQSWSGPATSTLSSMIIPASPTSRPATMRPRTPRSRSCATPLPGSPSAGSSSSGS